MGSLGFGKLCRGFNDEVGMVVVGTFYYFLGATDLGRIEKGVWACETFGGVAFAAIGEEGVSRIK